jgi:hypothetical protein
VAWSGGVGRRGPAESGGAPAQDAGAWAQGVHALMARLPRIGLACGPSRARHRMPVVSRSSRVACLRRCRTNFDHSRPPTRIPSGATPRAPLGTPASPRRCDCVPRRSRPRRDDLCDRNVSMSRPSGRRGKAQGSSGFFSASPPVGRHGPEEGVRCRYGYALGWWCWLGWWRDFVVGVSRWGVRWGRPRGTPRLA